MKHTNEVGAGHLVESVRQRRKSAFYQIFALDSLFFKPQLVSCWEVSASFSLQADWLASQVGGQPIPPSPCCDRSQFSEFNWLEGNCSHLWSGSVQGKALNFLIQALILPSVSDAQYWNIPGMGALVNWLLWVSELNGNTPCLKESEFLLASKVPRASILPGRSCQQVLFILGNIL